jgi:hypothetical protein
LLRAGTSGLPIISPDDVIDIDTSLDKTYQRDTAEIIGSYSTDDCHLPSKPRKFDGGVCCRAAVRTNIVLGTILLVFGGPSGSSKNKINIYAPNADNHVGAPMRGPTSCGWQIILA